MPNVAEQLGFSKSMFDNLYDSYNGFNSVLEQDKDIIDFDIALLNGSKKLLNDLKLTDILIQSFQ